jgi:hypothetical protein
MKIQFNIPYLDLDGKPTEINPSLNKFLANHMSINGAPVGFMPADWIQAMLKINAGEVVDFTLDQQKGMTMFIDTVIIPQAIPLVIIALKSCLDKPDHKSNGKEKKQKAVSKELPQLLP